MMSSLSSPRLLHLEYILSKQLLPGYLNEFDLPWEQDSDWEDDSNSDPTPGSISTLLTQHSHLQRQNHPSFSTSTQSQCSNQSKSIPSSPIFPKQREFLTNTDSSVISDLYSRRCDRSSSFPPNPLVVAQSTVPVKNRVFLPTTIASILVQIDPPRATSPHKRDSKITDGWAPLLCLHCILLYILKLFPFQKAIKIQLLHRTWPPDCLNPSRGLASTTSQLKTCHWSITA